jgi:hypothetical protein
LLDQRGQLLRAALGFAGCSLPSYDRALWALRTWLDSWPGIECIAVKAKQNGWAVAEDRWQRRISAGA